MADVERISWEEFRKDVALLAEKIKASGRKYNGLYGIPRGGALVAVMLSHLLELPMQKEPTYGDLVVDDICDSGETCSKYLSYADVACVYYKPHSIIMPTFYAVEKELNTWIQFPYETKLVDTISKVNYRSDNA